MNNNGISKSCASGNCCSSKPKEKEICIKCNTKAKSVLSKTLNSLLLKSTKDKLSSTDGYFYCKTSSCDVIYFNNDTILTKKDLSIEVGLKDGVKPAITCYCFNWSKEKIKEQLLSTGTTNVLEDIKYKMDTQGCNCELLNPSGACCLGDNTKAIKDIKNELGLYN